MMAMMRTMSTISHMRMGTAAQKPLTNCVKSRFCRPAHSGRSARARAHHHRRRGRRRAPYRVEDVAPAVAEGGEDGGREQEERQHEAEGESAEEEAEHPQRQQQRRRHLPRGDSHRHAPRLGMVHVDGLLRLRPMRLPVPARAARERRR
eukprot:scaffold1124_cov361-Prasinococcus_capsulatus_cf.AAC.20